MQMTYLTAPRMFLTPWVDLWPDQNAFHNMGAVLLGGRAAKAPTTAKPACRDRFDAMLAAANLLPSSAEAALLADTTIPLCSPSPTAPTSTPKSPLSSPPSSPSARLASNPTLPPLYPLESPDWVDALVAAAGANATARLAALLAGPFPAVRPLVPHVHTGSSTLARGVATAPAFVSAPPAPPDTSRQQPLHMPLDFRKGRDDTARTCEATGPGAANNDTGGMGSTVPGAAVIGGHEFVACPRCFGPSFPRPPLDVPIAGGTAGIPAGSSHPAGVGDEDIDDGSCPGLEELSARGLIAVLHGARMSSLSAGAAAVAPAAFDTIPPDAIVVLFCTPWCAPCRSLFPVFRYAARAFSTAVGESLQSLGDTYVAARDAARGGGVGVKVRMIFVDASLNELPGPDVLGFEVGAPCALRADDVGARHGVLMIARDVARQHVVLERRLGYQERGKRRERA